MKPGNYYEKDEPRQMCPFCHDTGIVFNRAHSYRTGADGYYPCYCSGPRLR